MSHGDDSYSGGPIFRAVPYNYFGGKPYAPLREPSPW